MLEIYIIGLIVSAVFWGLYKNPRVSFIEKSFMVIFWPIILLNVIVLIIFHQMMGFLYPDDYS